jgi:hypothetical protein
MRAMAARARPWEMSFSAVSDAQVIRKAAATMAQPKISTDGTVPSSAMTPVTMRRRRMGAGAEMTRQPPTSSQFLRAAFSFTGRASCPDGEGIDRGDPYREAIAGAPRATTEDEPSEGDPMQSPGG